MSETEAPDLARQWARTRLAHEAVLLQDAAGVLAEQREAVRAHRETLAEQPSSRPEEMGDITIGDQIHYHQPPARAGSPSKLSTLARAAAIAAAMAAGGLPAAGVTYWLTQPSPAETVSRETPLPTVTVPTIPDPIDWALELLPPE